MRMAIPNYAMQTQHLNQVLETVYLAKGNRTKYGMGKYKLLDYGWNNTCDNEFEYIKQSLVNRIKLKHPTPDSQICIFTDASDLIGWAGVVTFVNLFDESVPIQNQEHNPLGFVSGIFKGSQLNWHIQCKEAFAVHQTMTKMQHITRSWKCIIYSDSQNTCRIFSPHRPWVDEELPRATTLRRLRWAEELTNFKYEIIHIPGEIMENFCFADMLSRWGNPDVEKVELGGISNYVIRRAQIRQVRFDSLENHGYSTILDAFQWPSFESLSTSQTENKQKCKLMLEQVREDGLISPVFVGNTDRGLIWIPDNDMELKVSLLILAHCSMSGHRGKEHTRNNLKDFWWSTIEKMCQPL